MRSRLQQFLAVLCILAMLAGCMALSAFAEDADPVSKAIAVVWADEDDYEGLRPDFVKVTIDTADGKAEVELKEGNDWTGEKTVPADAKWNVPEVSDYSKEVTGDKVTIVTYTHNPETTSFSASVAWSDNEDAASRRPESVRINLLADGVVCRAPVTTTAAKGWAASWDNLPKNRAKTTTPIVYTVAPADKLEAYESAVSGTVVTYTLKTANLSVSAEVYGVPEGADVSGLKLVISGPNPGMPITKKLSEINGTLDLGEVLPGSYVLQEENADSLIEGYVMDPAGTQVGDAVYLKAGASGTLHFKYTWKEPEEEEENPDPMSETGKLSFTIIGPDPRLPKTVYYSDFTNGKYELDNLIPGDYAVIETNPEGLVRAYTLTSNSVTGMALTVGKDGATATLLNRYVPAPMPAPDDETINIPVTKIWVDDNDKDGNRPDSVTVKLFADGVLNDTMKIKGPGWTGVFAGKRRYNDDGTEIKYTINEEPVAWYTTKVNGYAITNTYQPETTTVSVIKVWNDKDNARKMRPTSIAVTLLPTKEVFILNEANGWSIVKTGLPTRIDGEPVTYSWKEQEVAGYISGTSVSGTITTITNTIPGIPKIPEDEKKPKLPGEPVDFFDEYDTALGGQLLINHVGDCFD